MLSEICNKLSFPDDSVHVFEKAHSVLTENEDMNIFFQKALQSLLVPSTAAFDEATGRILSKTDIHPYTLNMVLCLSSLGKLQEIYESVGKRDMFDVYVKNLKPLLEKCKESSGIWGLKNALWNWMFHEHQCVRLGRLEFEPYFHFSNVEYKGIKKHDPVVLIHIPGGSPLDMNEVQKSLKLGYGRFKDKFENGIVPFMTHSWLIYPPYFDFVFKKGGNLHKFAKLFEVIEQNDEKFANFATVFGIPYSADALDKVPQETSLQRNMLKFIKEGNPMGQGYGIFFYGK